MLAKLLVALAAIAPAAQAAPAAPAAAPHHFHDSAGNSLETFDTVWNGLARFFGAATPARITVGFVEGGLSYFDAERDAIFLAPSHYTGQPTMTVAHETSHLALDHLTKGASGLNELRFVDEGFAEIISYALAGKGAIYERNALIVAAQAHQAGRVGFALVQDWKHYFGTPPNLDFRAYPVGASFVFHLRNLGGWPKVRAFFEALGHRPDLGQALAEVYGLDLPTAERGWQTFLAGVDLSIVPHVVRLTPPAGTDGVPTTTTEVVAEFDQDMNTDPDSLCVLTPCADGLCYRKARWETPRRLVIPADPTLRPGHAYVLSLGVENRCQLSSSQGIALDLVPWTFRTAQ